MSFADIFSGLSMIKSVDEVIKQNNNKYMVISLFSDTGCMDLGLKQAGLI